MTINMYIATVAWLVLIVGFTQRKNRKLHPPLMMLGMAMDIALVLYLQVTRSAVQTAASFELEPLQMVHIGFSTLAVVFYLPTFFFGFKMVRGGDVATLLPRHKMVAIPALLFRSLGFIFMFSMME